MALVDRSKVERRAIPHEPGEWMEFRQLSWEDWPDADKYKGKAATKATLLVAIAAWSYKEPVSEATIGRLDAATMTWASKEAVALNGGGLVNLGASSNGSISETVTIPTN